MPRSKQPKVVPHYFNEDVTQGYAILSSKETAPRTTQDLDKRMTQAEGIVWDYYTSTMRRGPLHIVLAHDNALNAIEVYRIEPQDKHLETSASTSLWPDTEKALQYHKVPAFIVAGRLYARYDRQGSEITYNTKKGTFERLSPRSVTSQVSHAPKKDSSTIAREARLPSWVAIRNLKDYCNKESNGDYTFTSPLSMLIRKVIDENPKKTSASNPRLQS